MDQRIEPGDPNRLQEVVGADNISRQGVGGGGETGGDVGLRSEVEDTIRANVFEQPDQ